MLKTVRYFAKIVPERSKMSVKIIRCSDKDSWYARKIGEVFEVKDYGGISQSPDEYFVPGISNGSKFYYIQKKDCKVL
jgi:hypothetical protein